MKNVDASGDSRGVGSKGTGGGSGGGSSNNGNVTVVTVDGSRRKGGSGGDPFPQARASVIHLITM